jgi:hypothetical protein
MWRTEYSVHDLMQTKHYYESILIEIELVNFWWTSPILNFNNIHEKVCGIHGEVHLWHGKQASLRINWLKIRIAWKHLSFKKISPMVWVLTVTDRQAQPHKISIFNLQGTWNSSQQAHLSVLCLLWGLHRFLWTRISQKWWSCSFQSILFSFLLPSILGASNTIFWRTFCLVSVILHWQEWLQLRH